MGAAELAAFLGVSAVVIVTPGQDTALTIRNTLRGGRSGGVWTAAGVVTGQLAWAVATSAGLAAVLLASQPAFTALKLVGAAYLVYLGVASFVSAVRSRGSNSGRAEPGGTPRMPPARRAYRQGLLSNLGNPKMAVFFTSLLPQFVSAPEASFWTLLPLGVLFGAMTFVWLGAYAVAVARARAVLERPALRRFFDAVTGVVLVALGLRLAAER
jgi:threonine/homoserine/homoserine lactone efflux protein